MALALREVETAFGDGGGEVVEDIGVADGRIGATGDWCDSAASAADQVHALEAVTQLGVGMPLEGIQVGPHGAGEEHRVLRDDGEPAAQIVQLDLGNILPVDVNGARTCLEEAEERER